MKEFVLDSEVPVVGEAVRPALREKLAAFVELTKPRITVLVMLTAAAGYFLGAGRTLYYAGFLHTMAGTGLLSSGIAALNMFMERELDARMRRTLSRPLPAGKVSAAHALAFGNRDFHIRGQQHVSARTELDHTEAFAES